MQKPSYLGEIAIMSIGFRILLTKTKILSPLDTHIYQILVGITIFIPMGQFFHTMFIIDYYACTNFI